MSTQRTNDPSIYRQLVDTTYWFYSDGALELAETLDDEGTHTVYQRSILGPIPREDLYAIVRNGPVTSLDDPDWEAKMIDYLRPLQFKIREIQIPQKFEPIPSIFDNDPVLKQHLCPISGRPIRLPYRSYCRHVYDWTSILQWIFQLNAEGKVPKCCLGCGILRYDDFHFDSALSDRIELRLLLLQALRLNNM